MDYTASEKQMQTSLLPISTISISEILKNVNKRDTAETAGQVQNELDVSPTDNISNNRLAQEKPIVKNSIFTLIKK